MAVATRTTHLDEPTTLVLPDGREVEAQPGWYGEDQGPCSFVTSGWPTQDIAQARIDQHAGEHETGELMQDVEEFRADHGLEVDENGAAVFASPKED